MICSLLALDMAVWTIHAGVPRFENVGRVLLHRSFDLSALRRYFSLIGSYHGIRT